MDKFEQRLALTMLCNLLRGSPHNHRAVLHLTSAVNTVADYVQIDNDEPHGLGKVLPLLTDLEIEDPRHRRALITRTKKRKSELKNARPGIVETNLRRLARFFRLDQTDAAILGAIVRAGLGDPWEELLGSSMNPLRAQGIAAATRIALPMVHSRLRATAPLCQFGIITVDSDGDISVLRKLVTMIPTQLPKSEWIADWLLPAPASATLDLRDFDHLGEDIGHVYQLLKGATEERATGVHVLLYGPSGTGKTELAKSLAAAIDMPLYSIGEADDEGDEPVRYERLGAYRMAQRLLSTNRQSLILFDEAEDIFSHDDGLGIPLFGFRCRRSNLGSKVFMNRLLEQTPVPTIWTTNSTEPMGPTIIRRMTYAIEVTKPNVAGRARIWHNSFKALDMDVDPNVVRQLAIEFDEAPALASAAVRAAKLMAGNVDDARRTAAALSKAMTGQAIVPRLADAVQHDPSLLNADADLLSIENQLVEHRPVPAVSFCLSGPPGTGKSAWARHLAQRLELELLEKRASDLLSPWVGMTERQIAGAFEEARRGRRFLIIDEADGLLADRRGATRSFEVTQVNELLTWMESHNLPLAMTTNLIERLDPAAMRRFVFKIQFGFLTPDQARLAFKRFFGLTAPVRLTKLDNLTPGDFAVVRRRAAAMGVTGDADVLLEMLVTECEAKPGFRRAIGFAA